MQDAGARLSVGAPAQSCLIHSPSECYVTACGVWPVVARQLQFGQRLLTLKVCADGPIMRKYLPQLKTKIWLLTIASLGAGQAVPASEAPGTKPTAPRERNPRVLFITAKDSPRCDEELARLRHAGGEFDKMRSA